jgi:hypothetical protein
MGDWRGITARAAAVAGPVAGTGAYLAWIAYEFGDPWLPFTIQSGEKFRGSADNPLLVAVRAVTDLVLHGPHGNAAHALPIVVAVALCVVAFRRWPASYGAFIAIVLSSALAAEKLGSFERYAWTAFPLAIVAAGVARRPDVERAVLTVSAATMGVLGTIALLGGYVP